MSGIGHDLLDAVGLSQVQPDHERLQWQALMRDGTVVRQYDEAGVQAKFAHLSAGEVAAVWLFALMPLPGAGVEFIQVLACILHVPPGAQAELLYRGGVDVTMGADGVTAEVPLPREMLCGWRQHNGSRQECWVAVTPDGVAHAGIDPQRAWPA